MGSVALANRLFISSIEKPAVNLKLVGGKLKLGCNDNNHRMFLDNRLHLIRELLAQSIRSSPSVSA